LRRQRKLALKGVPRSYTGANAEGRDFSEGPQHAGFVERLSYYSLACDLRAGKMKTILNGEIVCEARARRLVARARHGLASA